VRLIWVSNHGGRQLDQTEGTIDALPRIADAISGSAAEIVVDGGFTRGTDIVKAIARGAKVVAVGRMAVWGLAADGGAGVARVFELLREEMRIAMGLSGRTKLSDLTRETVFRVD
jgi:glycolate oxidase